VENQSVEIKLSALDQQSAIRKAVTRRNALKSVKNNAKQKKVTAVKRRLVTERAKSYIKSYS
jgi:hypothetical protein